MEKIKAVALRYPENSDAPYIAATGTGFQAEKILQLAEENNIPVVKNKDAVEILSIHEPGELIPESSYTLIAEIFAFIKKVERNG